MNIYKNLFQTIFHKGLSTSTREELDGGATMLVITILGAEVEKCPHLMDSELSIDQSSGLSQKYVVVRTCHWH